MLLRKTLFPVVVLLVSVWTLAGQEPTTTVTTESRWHRSSVDNAFMNKRIADAAEQYSEHAPIARIAFYDIGYPKDKAEFDQLNGYGLLLISTLSQEEAELPLKRVYAVVAGKEIELKSIKQLFIKATDKTTQIVKTFGSYRVDSLYLFPVHLRFENAEILADFEKNRKGMKIAVFKDTDPEILRGLPRTRPDAKRTIDEPIKSFMRREYPGYFEQ